MSELISPTGRILGTRITVYDVLDYAEHHHTYVAAWLGISSGQVEAARQFIEEHRDQVMAAYQAMMERDARGNPPEIREKLKDSHAKLMALKTKLAQRKEGRNGARRRSRL
jgi:hypothetical protein